MIHYLKHVFNNKRLVRTLSGTKPPPTNFYFPYHHHRQRQWTPFGKIVVSSYFGYLYVVMVEKN